MILVTGATGKVGSEVARQLAAKGEAVRVLARSPEKARALFPAGVEIARGDLTDAASLDAALAGADRLFLLAPTDREQVAMEVNAIEAAKRAGVKRVVKLSVLGADEESPVILARWHREVEKVLAGSGIPFTLLQPTFFMQNFLGSAGTIQAQGAIYAPVRGRTSFVDARDIASVAVAALTEEGHEGKTYVVTGPEAITYGQAAERISAVIGNSVGYVEVPAEAARSGMIEAGIPDWYADDLIALFGIINAGWTEEVVDTVRTVAKKEPITFDQFARDHAQVFAGTGELAGV
ncbi:SDR family oxidoreductase [Longimicrobium sp.]|uniref:SDR family oxidoreductase n=1 Tax=Longimicrobium sp. TaxID=2029185 RepID=UPI002BA42A61|nr:SDR family oxidoreductase [Longimicrobium sp.]HSU14475.1 SDR family oxidoreductase [Longimicrobium sp.]